MNNKKILDYSLIFTEDIKNIIKDTLNINDISDIEIMKTGMTNNSFIFKSGNDKYVFRFPGEGTEFLINRKNEKTTYLLLEDKNICDAPLYLNENNGYKISKFIENVRVCNAENNSDLELCMSKLKEFHSLELKSDYYFDIYERLNFYESLWGNNKSKYKDYYETKDKVLKLRKLIESNIGEKYLCHIDAVSDNFLIYKDKNGKEVVQLNDWEYAGMQDPDVDIAMFCIYSLYTKEQIDNLIDIYFQNGLERIKKIKIYSYIALCGLLWSNWCEYKRQLGVNFGDYALGQYKFAKEFYEIVRIELIEMGLEETYGL